jgi:murein DD-endopeptidase MepM/ murein hydrolase activator NlpD
MRRTITFALLFLLAFCGVCAWKPIQVQAAISSSDWSKVSFPVARFQAFTSPYGTRVHPVTGEAGSFHYGQDIAAPEDSQTLAWAAGTVEWVKVKEGGCGHEVLVLSGDWESRYCHLSKINVKEGDPVKAGQVIGAVGQTGSATGPHLHWEVYYRGKILDPMRVLKAMSSSQANNRRKP